MREHDRPIPALALLLSVSLVALGCADDQGRHGLSTTTHDWTAGDDREDGSGTDAAPESEGTSGEEPQTSGDSSEGSTSTPVDDSTGEASGSTSGESSSDGGGSAEALCEAYRQRFTECFPDNVEDAPGEYDYCLYSMQTGVDHSPPCAAAYEALFGCLAVVDCDNWPISTATEVACPDEDAALYTDCAS